MIRRRSPGCCVMRFSSLLVKQTSNWVSLSELSGPKLLQLAFPGSVRVFRHQLHSSLLQGNSILARRISVEPMAKNGRRTLRRSFLSFLLCINRSPVTIQMMKTAGAATLRTTRTPSSTWTNLSCRRAAVTCYPPCASWLCSTPSYRCCAWSATTV